MRFIVLDFIAYHQKKTKQEKEGKKWRKDFENPFYDDEPR